MVVLDFGNDGEHTEGELRGKSDATHGSAERQRSPWPATARIVTSADQQLRSREAGSTLSLARENLQHASVELSEKMRTALEAQHLLLDKYRRLLAERRRQLALSRSLVASCRRLIGEGGTE